MDVADHRLGRLSLPTPAIVRTLKERETGMALLEVFVTPGCWACNTALEIAHDLEARAIPGVSIQIVDLSLSNAEPPEHVMAVPTYCLDGKVISMGNPEETELVAHLQTLSESPSR